MNDRLARRTGWASLGSLGVVLEGAERPGVRNGATHGIECLKVDKFSPIRLYQCYTVTNEEVGVATSPVRVPATVHNEVHATARLFGCSASELLDRAWQSFRESPDFMAEFEAAQKAFSVGDLDHLTSRLTQHAADRADRRASSVQALRRRT